MKVFANIYESNGNFTPNLWLSDMNPSGGIGTPLEGEENNFHARVLLMVKVIFKFLWII